MTASREYIDKRIDCSLTAVATPWHAVLDSDGSISVQTRNADGKPLTTAAFVIEVSNDGGPDGYAVSADYATASTINQAGMQQLVTAGAFKYIRLRVSTAEAGKFVDVYWLFKPTAGAVAAK